MTANEVAALLAMFAAAYPHAKITEQTPYVWAKHLERIDAADALDAANLLIDTAEHMPSIAEFKTAVRPFTAKRVAAKQAADYERKALGEGGEFVGDPAENRHGVSQHVRAILAAQRGKQHWHGGPDPCPVCGGINPNLKPGESVRAHSKRERSE